jgi:DNA topoisomerase VI subunit B
LQQKLIFSVIVNGLIAKPAIIRVSLSPIKRSILPVLGFILVAHKQIGFQVVAIKLMVDMLIAPIRWDSVALQAIADVSAQSSEIDKLSTDRAVYDAALRRVKAALKAKHRRERERARMLMTKRLEVV